MVAGDAERAPGGPRSLVGPRAQNCTSDRLLDLGEDQRRRAPCPRRCGSPSWPRPRRPSPAPPAGSARRTRRCPGRAPPRARVALPASTAWTSPCRRYMGPPGSGGFEGGDRPPCAAHGSRRACDKSVRPPVTFGRDRQGSFVLPAGIHRRDEPRPGSHEDRAAAHAPAIMGAHVRDRRDPRSGRGAGEHAVTGMVEALRHRGPDGQAVRRLGPATLAHTRLAIIDVAGGDQPLDSEDGVGHGDRERRDLQPPRPARRARARRAPLRDPLRQRGRGARLRAARPRLRPPG